MEREKVRDGVYVVTVTDDDVAGWVAEFEQRAGNTVMEAVETVRRCGCCFDTPDHLAEHWFRDQVRLLADFVPGARERLREVSRRRYDAEIS